MAETSRTESPVFIVVVEDEDAILEMLEIALADEGFSVKAVRSGDAAFKLLEIDSTQYRAIVTDIDFNFGRMDGWDVARKARQIFPEIAVIYMTGGAVTDWPAKGVPNSVLIQKPFATSQVVTAVSQLLNLTEQSQ